eukprot:4052063-Pyramimonas_sp.AAC.1
MALGVQMRTTNLSTCLSSVLTILPLSSRQGAPYPQVLRPPGALYAPLPLLAREGRPVNRKKITVLLSVIGSGFNFPADFSPGSLPPAPPPAPLWSPP